MNLRHSIARLVLAISAVLAMPVPSLAAAPANEIPKAHDEVAAAIDQAMRDHLYNPKLIDTPAYAAITAEVAALAAQPLTRADFLAGFNDLWQHGPYSHVVLAQSQGSPLQMAQYFDSMNIGGGGAKLSWQADTAVLTVTTMMGQDTIEEVHAAFAEIARHTPRALVLDLRANKGGAFVSRALISHLISEPFEAGVFMSREWYAGHDGTPTREDALALEPWDGWSVQSFWADVQAQPLTRVQLQPVAPVFKGEVWVLVSSTTASAAELTAEALRSARHATLVGERSAGKMLSQTPYDVPEGLQIFLPIADYYTHGSGRIEGTGLSPDIEVPADQALTIALARIAGGAH
jgi:carboxyl-terminal processing protease